MLAITLFAEFRILSTFPLNSSRSHKEPTYFSYPSISVRFKPANLGSRGENVTPRSPSNMTKIHLWLPHSVQTSVKSPNDCIHYSILSLQGWITGKTKGQKRK